MPYQCVYAMIIDPEKNNVEIAQKCWLTPRPARRRTRATRHLRWRSAVTRKPGQVHLKCERKNSTKNWFATVATIQGIALMARARGARAADNAQFEQTEVHVDAITTQPGQILGPPLPVRSRETGKNDDDKGNLPEEGFGRDAPGKVNDYLAPHPRGLANQAEFDWAETMLYQLHGGGAGWLSDDVCGAAAGGDDDVRDALATLDVDLDGQIATARGMFDAAYHLNAKRSSVGCLNCFTFGLIIPPFAPGWAMNALIVATFPCITGPICCFPALTGQRCYTHNCICAKMFPFTKSDQFL